MTGFPGLRRVVTPRLLRGLRPARRPSAGNGPAPAGLAARQRGRPPDGSHVHHATDRRGRRPALPRRHRHDYAVGFHRGLPTGRASARLRSCPTAPSPVRSRTAARPISARLEPVGRLDGALDTGFSRTPSRLASRTRAVWQYQPVPALSGLLPTLPGVPRLRLLPSFTGLLRQPGGEGLSPPPGSHGASWRTMPSTHTYT